MIWACGALRERKCSRPITSAATCHIVLVDHEVVDVETNGGRPLDVDPDVDASGPRSHVVQGVLGRPKELARCWSARRSFTDGNKGLLIRANARLVKIQFPLTTAIAPVEPG